MTMSIWRLNSEHPSVSGPVTGLIALPGDADSSEPFLLGIVMWRSGRWEDEGTGKPIGPYPRFWWCLEDDLLADLPKG